MRLFIRIITAGAQLPFCAIWPNWLVRDNVRSRVYILIKGACDPTQPCKEQCNTEKDLDTIKTNTTDKK